MLTLEFECGSWNEPHFTAARIPSSDLKSTPKEAPAEGDTIAVRSTMTATHRGEFAGIPPTGKHVTAGVMLLYRIAEGKIAQFWMQLDVASITSQLTS